MNKELQDLAWSILPKEFKEVVKKRYKYSMQHRNLYSARGAIETLELFGHHNLTSDAEGEEILTVSRKRLQDAFYSAKIIASSKMSSKMLAGAADMCINTFNDLFGSKCLPDGNEDNFATKEPKPFKYSVGQKVILHFYGGEVSTITEAFNDGGVWNKYKVKMLPTRVWNENELDPYEEPKPAEPNIVTSSPTIDDILKSNADLDPETEKLIDEAVEKFLQPIKEYFEKLDEKPAEPKFKVGDKVKYKGRVKVVISEMMPNRYYRIALPNNQSPICKHESDLEPYTEPEENHIADPGKMVDAIIKDGFSKERRLNIAAMAMQGMLSNTTRFSSYEIRDLVRISLNCADALIKKTEGGSK